MDPFFRNPSWYKHPDPHSHSFSHYPRGGAAAHPIQRPPIPKVVQIPVHFVGSEPVNRSGSALKIQKVFRGFLVRKCMKRIKDVKKQVDAIEEKLLRREEMELIRRDEKERLRMSEGLMSLLLNLDSIRGFDLGVRDCRKAVIRKAIALQEKIDAVNLVPYGEEAETEEREPKARVPAAAETNDQEPEITVSMETEIKCQEPEIGVPSESDCLINQSHNLEKLEGSVEMVDECGEESGDVMNAGEDDGEIESIVDVGVDSEVKVGEVNRSSVLVEDSFIKNDTSDWVKVEGGEKGTKVHGWGDNKNNEMMDRMMQDNEKMMNMMTQLFDSNEKQMKTITALAHRVEMLEKAFMCDKRRKKKLKPNKKASSCGEE